MKVEYVIIPQIVNVRKYPVDETGLKKILKENKRLSNKEIAEKLNVTITKVEHWFRSDNYFCIPDSEIWFDLKKLLGINTDYFDKSIMTFEEKIGTFEKAERTYLITGLSPCLLTTGVESILIQK